MLKPGDEPHDGLRDVERALGLAAPHRSSTLVARGSARGPAMSASGEAAEQRVQVALPVRVGGARQHPAVSGRDTFPEERLPDIEPDDGFRHSKWCHGGILRSVGRSEPLPATPALPGRGACDRRFPISRPERRAPPVATPPGPSAGQGRTAIRRRPIGGPSGLARIVGDASNARHRIINRWPIPNCNGRDPVTSGTPAIYTVVNSFEMIFQPSSPLMKWK